MTRLYFHSPDSAVGGTLPLTEQSSRTAALNFDAQTVNRSMDTIEGTGQVQLFRNSANATDTIIYITKFVSDPLDMTAVAANTWTYNFAFQIVSDAAQTAPIKQGGGGEFGQLPITCYVWRPGTGTKVGDIFDSLTAGTNGEFFDCSQAAVDGKQEFAEDGVFTGSAVASVQTGDVIIFEAWCYSSDNSARTNALKYYFDGATVNTTSTAVVSNHASFLETPETLVFQGAPAVTTGRLYHSFSPTGFMPSQASRTF